MCQYKCSASFGKPAVGCVAVGSAERLKAELKPAAVSSCTPLPGRVNYHLCDWHRRCF